REFCEKAFDAAGLSLLWEGKGLDEKGIAKDNGMVVVEVDSQYFRPAEVELLVGDASKARRVLGWEPEYSLEQMIEEMVASDLNLNTRNL
ncbi:MAG: GDP-mannose 4,6-dehydratase, partial [Bacteroidetes bacterium]|nr:GDP-mannose 4,6-dehydratase [Bacteroidota bacterium]